MTIPIRLKNTHTHITLSNQPQELYPDMIESTLGIPWLHGRLGIALAQPLNLMLQIHNGNGVPIIEGCVRLEAGEQHFTFRELHPLGIEAYAHALKNEQVQIGRRVWSRAVYGTLLFS